MKSCAVPERASSVGLHRQAQLSCHLADVHVQFAQIQGAIPGSFMRLFMSFTKASNNFRTV